MHTSEEQQRGLTQLYYHVTKLFDRTLLMSGSRIVYGMEEALRE
jgi:hypothetical protein